MKRFVKLFLSFVLSLSFCYTLVLSANDFDFSKTEVVKSYEVVTDKELDCGVKLYQYNTVAYNDGIIDDSKLNDYVVSWLDYGTNKNVRIVNYTSTYVEEWSGGAATVLAKKYEQNHPGYLVIGAINGDFFHISENDEVNNLSMQEGEMLKPYIWDAIGIGVLGWTYDGQIIEGIPTISSNMYLEQLDEEGNKISEKEITAVNKAVSDTGITIISKDLEKATGITKYDFTGMTVVEVSYILHRFSLDGNENNDRLFVKGVVSNISKDLKTDEEIPTGTVYLVAKDDSLDYLSVGDNVRCQYHLTGEWEDVYNTTGYYAKILNNGESLFKHSGGKDYSTVVGDPSYINCKKNRTVIGKRPDGSTIMMTIEYRKDGNYGASYYECAEYLKTIGCTDGWLLDGGGSTSMALRQPSGDFKLIAGGSDGHERSNGNAILLVVKDPGFTPLMSNVSRFGATMELVDNESPFRKDVYDINIEVNGQTFAYNNEPIILENLEEDTEYVAIITYKMKLDNGEVFEGKIYRSFETLSFSMPNVTLQASQTSNTELVIRHSIRKANDVEIKNFVIHQGDKSYPVEIGDSLHITDLEPLTSYDFYATFDAVDPVTNNTYSFTTQNFECSTIKNARPIIVEFKLIKHAGTKIEFAYEYSDVNNEVEYAYIEYFGSVNKVEGTTGTKAFEGFDVTQREYVFTFRLKTATGEIISHKITLEKADTLPPTDEIENPTITDPVPNEPDYTLGIVLGVIGVVIIAGAVIFIFIKNKKNKVN